MFRLLLPALFFLLNAQFANCQLLAGDECGNAPFITINSCANNFASRTYSISDSSASPLYHCDGVLYHDAWVKINVPMSGNLELTMNEQAISYSYRFAVFSGVCGNLNYITCSGGSRKYPQILLRNLIPNEVIFIRIWAMPQSMTSASSPTFPFNICAADPIIPSNDSCTNPKILTVNSFVNRTILQDSGRNSTQSGQIPQPSCSGINRSDLWYSAIVPSNGNIGFVIPKDSNFNSGVNLTVYTGSCGNLTQIYCENDPDITALLNQTPNTTLLVRVAVNYSSDISERFNIGAFTFSEPVNNDCTNAKYITTQNSCSPNTAQKDSIMFAASLSNIAIQCNPNNLTVTADVWYKTTIPISGNLAIEVPGMTYIELYDNNCSSPNLIGCAEGKKPLIIENQTPNDTVLIRVHTGWQMINKVIFCLSDPSIPINNTCSAPTSLNVGLGDSCNVTSINARFTTKEVLLNDTCNPIGRDLWYSIVVPSSGEFYLRDFFHPQLGNDNIASLYQLGNCDSLFPILCNQHTNLTGPFTIDNFKFIQFSNLNPFDTLLLRMSIGSGSGFSFATDQNLEICLTEQLTLGSVPITLSYFKGTKNEKLNELTWQTLSEFNSKEFAIERSADNTSWKKIGTIPATGKSNKETNYSFTDIEPLQNFYYRIKMIDIDNGFEYSKTIYLEHKPESNSITIFPNPIDENFTISIKEPDVIQSLFLYDGLGKIIKKIEPKNKQVLSLRDYPAGIYLLHTKTIYGFENIKILKR